MNAMMIDRATVQKALDALAYAKATDSYERNRQNEAITALSEAIEADQQPDGLHVAAVDLENPIPTFDEVFDKIDWDVWRMKPIRELVRMIHGKTSSRQEQDALRIAELEAEVERFRAHALNEKSARKALEKQHNQRGPLTTAEVEQLLARWDYQLHGDRARYLVRETEKVHGVGVEQNSNSVEFDGIKTPESVGIKPGMEQKHEYSVDLQDDDTRKVKIRWSDREQSDGVMCHRLYISVTETKPAMELYGWGVTGCLGVYRGEHAQHDAEAMARRCGGTSRAFALYREAPKP